MVTTEVVDLNQFFVCFCCQCRCICFDKVKRIVLKYRLRKYRRVEKKQKNEKSKKFPSALFLRHPIKFRFQPQWTLRPYLRWFRIYGILWGLLLALFYFLRLVLLMLLKTKSSMVGTFLLKYIIKRVHCKCIWGCCCD